MTRWEKLKPYQGDRRKSFEELCYQVAKGLYGHLGRFTSVDDSGGGDGVEFYLTLPDGTEWGWQAKFYYPESRLSVSGRKKSIEGSLERAVEQHPNLPKWFLCTPTNLTGSEQTWFDQTLPTKLPDTATVRLEHWDDSDFNNWLSEPKFSGKRHYFFGDLELSLDWFKGLYAREKRALGDKYNPQLHVESWVDRTIHAVLGASHQAEAVSKAHKSLVQSQKSFLEAERNFQSRSYGFLWEEAKNPVLDAAEEVNKQIDEALRRLEQVVVALDEGRIAEVQEMDLKLVSAALQDSLAQLRDVTKAVDVDGLLEEESDVDLQSRNDRRQLVTRLLHYGELAVSAEKFGDNFASIVQSIEQIKKPEQHIVGDAGKGKTHVACNICEEQLKRDKPAIFLRGGAFTSLDPLTVQLQNLLDVPSSYNWTDTLAALDAAAEAYRTRIPIIIDGLNESVVGGQFSPVWYQHLPSLCEDIKAHPNLVLIISYRSSYQEELWGNTEADNPLHLGFSSYDVEEALSKYFSFYNITADVTGASLAHFEHPLYLKLFCEVTNPQRQNNVQVYLGQQTLFEVFEAYFEQVNANLNRRLGRRSSVDTIGAAVSKIASHLWDNHSRTVPLDDLAQAVDAQPLSQLDWEGSITKALEDEGLLLYRDMRDGDEVVAFTYDLVAGYSIAKHLLEANQADPEAFLGSSQTRSLLFEDESDITAYLFKEGLHPLYDDIRRCIAALLPTYSDMYLHELIEQGVGFRIGVEALFEMRPTLINARCIATVERLFAEPRNRPHLFKLATATLAHVDHPLNISFWSQLLCGLSMPECDKAWSEYVRGNDGHFLRLVKSFEERLQSPTTPTPLAESRLHLLAQIAMWLLTSTVRPLRDVATRSLYYYGRRYPTEFFGLVKSSFEIDDPYVRERMVAAAYGVAMAYRHELSKGSNEPKALIGAAQTLFELMFAQGAPYATTHVLTHEYAKRTINLILEFHPTLLDDGEKARLEQPYPSKSSTWQELAPADGSYFGEGDSPMHMDFANYTLGGLVPDRNNYDFNHPEYQKVHRQILWRIHDLGYSSEHFGKVDEGLANYNFAAYQRKSDGRKIDRYGKKYSWIAYHELYGLRQDKGLLKERLFTPPERPYSADIDPSFPKPVEQHQLVKENFLGDLNEPLYDWIREGGLPDIKPYLVVKDLKSEPGSWVLLNGYVNQVNKDAQRGRFTFIRGLIVKDSERDLIRERLEQQNLGGRWLPEIFEEHLTFAGEVPWADTFHANNVQELRFLVGGLRRDAEVPETAATESDEKNSLMLSVGSTTDEPECYKVLIPVQTVGWSESTSAANFGLSADVPSKELATELNLQSRPQTFDLFDTEGERASLMTEFKEGEEFNSDAEFFTFLRQDLLNTYLLETDQSLIWVVWGEREQEYESLPGMTHLPGKTYQVFQEIKVYKP